jgi:two-component system, LuxR family, response regulator FixJ
LLDLHLPGTSGVAVLKELNAHSYPAPIFIVTGDDDVISAVEAVKSGAFDYLVKPLEPRSIVARLAAPSSLSVIALNMPQWHRFSRS